MTAQLGSVGVLKKFFEEGKHGRKFELTDCKGLSSPERLELARLAAEEIGYKETEGNKFIPHGVIPV